MQKEPLERVVLFLFFYFSLYIYTCAHAYTHARMRDILKHSNHCAQPKNKNPSLSRGVKNYILSQLRASAVNVGCATLADFPFKNLCDQTNSQVSRQTSLQVLATTPTAFAFDLFHTSNRSRC